MGFQSWSSLKYYGGERIWALFAILKTDLIRIHFSPIYPFPSVLELRPVRHSAWIFSLEKPVSLHSILTKLGCTVLQIVRCCRLRILIVVRILDDFHQKARSARVQIGRCTGIISVSEAPELRDTDICNNLRDLLVVHRSPAQPTAFLVCHRPLLLLPILERIV